MALKQVRQWTLWAAIAAVAASLLLAGGWGVRTVLRLAREAAAHKAGRFDFEVARYKQLRPYKALAVCFDRPDGLWAWGDAFGFLTVQGAIGTARESCERGRQKQKIEAPCRIYAIGDEIVWDYTDAALEEMIKKFKSMEGTSPPPGWP